MLTLKAKGKCLHRKKLEGSEVLTWHCISFCDLQSVGVRGSNWGTRLELVSRGQGWRKSPSKMKMMETFKAKSWELCLTVKGSTRGNSKGTGMVWRDKAEMPRRNGDKRVYYRRTTFKRHCFGVREVVQCDDPMLEETTNSSKLSRNLHVCDPQHIGSK